MSDERETRMFGTSKTSGSDSSNDSWTFITCDRRPTSQKVRRSNNTRVRQPVANITQPKPAGLSAFAQRVLRCRAKFKVASVDEEARSIQPQLVDSPGGLPIGFGQLPAAKDKEDQSKTPTLPTSQGKTQGAKEARTNPPTSTSSIDAPAASEDSSVKSEETESRVSSILAPKKRKNNSSTTSTSSIDAPAASEDSSVKSKGTESRVSSILAPKKRKNNSSTTSTSSIDAPAASEDSSVKSKETESRVSSILAPKKRKTTPPEVISKVASVEKDSIQPSLDSSGRLPIDSDSSNETWPEFSWIETENDCEVASVKKATLDTRSSASSIQHKFVDSAGGSRIGVGQLPAAKEKEDESKKPTLPTSQGKTQGSKEARTNPPTSTSSIDAPTASDDSSVKSKGTESRVSSILAPKKRKNNSSTTSTSSIDAPAASEDSSVKSKGTESRVSSILAPKKRKNNSSTTSTSSIDAPAASDDIAMRKQSTDSRPVASAAVPAVPRDPKSASAPEKNDMLHARHNDRSGYEVYTVQCGLTSFIGSSLPSSYNRLLLRQLDQDAMDFSTVYIHGPRVIHLHCKLMYISVGGDADEFLKICKNLELERFFKAFTSQYRPKDLSKLTDNVQSSINAYMEEFKALNLKKIDTTLRTDFIKDLVVKWRTNFRNNLKQHALSRFSRYMQFLCNDDDPERIGKICKELWTLQLKPAHSRVPELLRKFFPIFEKCLHPALQWEAIPHLIKAQDELTAAGWRSFEIFPLPSYGVHHIPYSRSSMMLLWIRMTRQYLTSNVGQGQRTLRRKRRLDFLTNLAIRSDADNGEILELEGKIQKTRMASEQWREKNSTGPLPIVMDPNFWPTRPRPLKQSSAAEVYHAINTMFRVPKTAKNSGKRFGYHFTTDGCSVSITMERPKGKK